jgi:hypothetical protein
VLSQPEVQAFLRGTREGATVARQLQMLPARQAYVLACLPAIGQQHVLSVLPTGAPWNRARWGAAQSVALRLPGAAAHPVLLSAIYGSLLFECPS